MREIRLKNINPVTLSTVVDQAGQLQISCGETVLQDDDALMVGLASQADAGPICVSTRITDPGDGTQLRVQHEADDGTPVPWTRTANPSGCAFAWSETGREYDVRVTRAAPTSSQTKTVYIKVKPIEDLPDDILSP